MYKLLTAIIALLFACAITTAGTVEISNSTALPTTIDEVVETLQPVVTKGKEPLAVDNARNQDVDVEGRLSGIVSPRVWTSKYDCARLTFPVTCQRMLGARCSNGKFTALRRDLNLTFEKKSDRMRESMQRPKCA